MLEGFKTLIILPLNWFYLKQILLNQKVILITVLLTLSLMPFKALAQFDLQDKFGFYTAVTTGDNGFAGIAGIGFTFLYSKEIDTNLFYDFKISYVSVQSNFNYTLNFFPGIRLEYDLGESLTIGTYGLAGIEYISEPNKINISPGIQMGFDIDFKRHRDFNYYTLGVAMVHSLLIDERQFSYLNFRFGIRI